MKRLLLVLGFGVVATRAMASCAEDAQPVAPPKSDAGADQETPLQDASAVDAPDGGGCKPDAWCAVPLPVPAVSLNGLWGSGPNDVWIVGSPDTVLHWDGKQLAKSKVDTPQTLFGVWGSRADDVWIFSTGDAIWHSTGFSNGDPKLVPLARGDASAPAFPGPVSAMWGAGDSDVWAVGPFLSDPPTPPVWHAAGWNAGAPAWAPVLTSSATPPDAEPIIFNAVWGSAETGVWIAGMGGKTRWGSASSGATKWTAVNSGTSHDLYGVWGAGDGSVLAVGAGGTVRRFARTPGSAWAASEIVVPTSATLYSVYGFGDKNVWAAGSGGTLIHWDGAAWSVSPSGLADPAASDLFAIWGSGPDDVWAVGRNALLHRGSQLLPGTSP